MYHAQTMRIELLLKVILIIYIVYMVLSVYLKYMRNMNALKSTRILHLSFCEYTITNYTVYYILQSYRFVVMLNKNNNNETKQ